MRREGAASVSGHSSGLSWFGAVERTAVPSSGLRSAPDDYGGCARACVRCWRRVGACVRACVRACARACVRVHDALGARG